MTMQATAYLVVLLLYVTDVWTTTFCPVTSPFGDVVFFTDTPSTSQITSSLAECATGCAFSRSPAVGISNCRAFSYNKTSSNCSIYSSEPEAYQYDPSGNVVTYQYADQPVKGPWQTVPASQCDFSYEYRGQLYNKCRYEAPSANSKCAVGHYGCCLPTGEQAFCNPLSAGPNVTSFSLTYPYVDAQNCSFPFTHNGKLYNSCMRNIAGVTNDCHPASCKTTANLTIARCLPPADYVARLVNYTVSTSNQRSQLTLSVSDWIFTMRRRTGSGDGNWQLNWDSYVNGFGFNETYLWLGLERIHQLTTTGKWRLRLEYCYQDSNTWVSAEYWTFSLGDGSGNYILNVDGYSGDDYDQLRGGGYSYWTNNGMQFSTYDQDHDRCDRATHTCAIYGGWWFNCCGFLYFTYQPPSNNFNGAGGKALSEMHVMMKAR